MLNTKSDLLGWEGMRLRVAVREAQEKKGLEVSASPSPPGAHTHGTVSTGLDCTYIALSYPHQLPRYSVSLAPSHCLISVG